MACNIIECGTGSIDLETILLRLFAVDSTGCVGIKLGWITGADCENLTDLAECGMALTVEQALTQAIVDDGCGGWALGFFFTYPSED